MTSEIPEFTKFRKIPRLRREITVTEKIDGTNGVILIDEDNGMWVGSRKRWVTPSADNFGFAKWAYSHKKELLQLGPGRHYGEWWGQGIQRNYGLDHKRFSLFNTFRWCESDPQPFKSNNPTEEPRWQQVVPECCNVVPVLYRGLWNDWYIGKALEELDECGSFAAPGFKKPEGVVIYHDAGNVYFKQTLEDDASPKGEG